MSRGEVDELREEDWTEADVREQSRAGERDLTDERGLD